MRVVLVHNRYRSAAPSGETQVVEREGRALAGLGHDVRVVMPAYQAVEAACHAAGLDPRARAETLDLEAFAVLTRALYGPATANG